MNETLNNFKNSLNIRRGPDGFLAPNGLVSHYDNFRLQQFIRQKDFIEWFGDWASVEPGTDISQARYSDTGEPVLFTHRTKLLIEEPLSPEHDKTFGTEHGLAKKAIYFTTANLFEYGDYVHQGFLYLRNPTHNWSEVEEVNDGCLIAYEDRNKSVGYHAAVFSTEQFYPLVT